MNIFVNEYKRYKNLLEKALEQISDEDFFKQPDEHSNSIAIILKHISGNLLSRFTDFLTTDGEKEWRHRDSEFQVHETTKEELMEMWERAWQVLEHSVFSLGPEDMNKIVKIRGVQFTVEEALARSLSHFSYHVGQIIYLAKYFAGKNWQYLSIPPGQSETYNRNPTKEKGV
ncbi:MAG: DUF1572 domain-containing protein [Calditrichaeota bacterium]|nr:MAG: DUF1572 domain-containing protein [Calditrichota bacterium]